MDTNDNVGQRRYVEHGETMAAAAVNQPVAHPVNSAWNPLNQDHTPQALTYGAVTDPNAPHLPEASTL